MLLTIDIGNTSIFLGVFHNHKLIKNWRVASEKSKMADEYSLLLRQLLQSEDIDIKDIECAIVASVVPPLNTTLRNALEKMLRDKIIFVDHKLPLPVTLDIDNKDELGIDRLVHLTAGWHLYKESLLIIGSGTATTFDLLNSQAQYIGGITAPGIKISLEALANKTSKLPKIDLKVPKVLIGKNTEESMISGIFFGYLEMVDGFIERIARTVKEPFKVLLTGGYSSLIQKHLQNKTILNENLILYGLNFIFYHYLNNGVQNK